MPVEPKSFLTAIFDAAVAAAQPELTIRAHLPAKPRGRTIVIGAGKGSAQMAAALETAWDGPLEGLVVTRYGFARNASASRSSRPPTRCPTQQGWKRRDGCYEGLGPDGRRSGRRVDFRRRLGAAALSGRRPDVEDEIAVNKALLASGAPIAAMNVIRKHVSTIKGGRLAAAAYPARVVSLVVSDIPGDNPALVASGPTMPDAGTRAEALNLSRPTG